LDLLLLATVVQAITMVSRLREQNIAFANNQLPILEPFSEARELERANEGIRDELDIPPAEQHAVAAFPNYDAKRLRELISEEDETPTRLVDTRDDVRRAAVALLAAKHKGGATDAYLFRRALEAPGDSLRKWILDVASGLAPERDALKHPEDRDKLIGLLSDRVNRRIVAAPVRAAAARRLGRIGGGEDLALVLLERLADGGEDVEVRADAAVAIAKVDITENLRARAVENATALAATFSGPLIGEPLLPAMATAHALARLNPQTRAADVAKLFHEPLRKHAERAALIQVDDWKPAEAVKQAAVGDRMDQLVRIEPGEFNLGCDYDESRSDEGLREDQSPQTRVRIARAFALGRFPVTNREYRGYCDAMGLRGVNEDVGAIDAGKSKRPQVVDKDRFADFPVVQVSWYDANAYAGWLERITGERYRLPTEAEWEYACRAGTETPYWWGEFYGEDGKVDLFNISPVNLEGTGPNPWGLWSLYGHVYEWCADPWHPNYKGHPGTGEVWLEKCDPNKRVVRGGSFNWPRPGPEDANARRNELRSTYRNEQVPGHIQTNYGFRIARSLSK
jgi:formylglycine-generating enzyme required for sulfatase activity